MRKGIYYVLILAMLISLSACGSNSGNANVNEPTVTETPSAQEASGKTIVSEGDIDVDLTQLSSTMVYSEVYNMMVTPNDYVGKTVKMKGQFTIYEDPETNAIYYAVVIADTAACCSQGLEFVWKGEHSYPDDYPELGDEITVIGEFQLYEEEGNSYCHLVDADIT